MNANEQVSSGYGFLSQLPSLNLMPQEGRQGHVLPSATAEIFLLVSQVWKFLIFFRDVLGIWPFTLDEFLQAFHDYYPRQLEEIHLALLGTIIKDIEDMARTPATGLGAHQNSAANPGCGRIFVELHDGLWRLIDSAQGFDSLLSCLDVHGVREFHLHMMLQKVVMSFKEALRRNIVHANVEGQSGTLSWQKLQKWMLTLIVALVLTAQAALYALPIVIWLRPLHLLKLSLGGMKLRGIVP